MANDEVRPLKSPFPPGRRDPPPGVRTAGDRQAEEILALNVAQMKTSDLILRHVIMARIAITGASKANRLLVEKKREEIIAEIDKRMPVPAV